MSLEQKVTAFLARWQMLKPGDRVLCALSGGGDSMAMTHLLWKLAEKERLQISAAHFIHGLRPEDAPRERALVEEFCHSRGIPLEVGQGDTLAYCRSHSCGIEEGARALRYAFLRQTAQKMEADRIATAHHRQDNAETILLNLCRGTGLRGLGGIPPVEDRLIRPLLTASREEIEKYLCENSIPYCQDPSNETDVYARNRLRHQVVPALEKINSKAVEHICQMGERARQDELFLQESAQRLLEEASCGPGRAKAQVLAAAPASLALRAVQLLYQKGGGGETLSAEHRQAVWALCSQGPSARLSLPGGIEACRIYDVLCCRKKQEKEGGFPPCQLEEGKMVCQGNWQVTLYRDEAPLETPGERFRFAALTEPLWVRPRREGDQIALRGGHKKIKKWMIEKKIPASLRESIPLVCDAQGVVLICGGPCRIEEKRQGPGWTIVVRRKENDGDHAG